MPLFIGFPNPLGLFDFSFTKPRGEEVNHVHGFDIVMPNPTLHLMMSMNMNILIQTIQPACSFYSCSHLLLCTSLRRFTFVQKTIPKILSTISHVWDPYCDKKMSIFPSTHSVLRLFCIASVCAVYVYIVSFPLLMPHSLRIFSTKKKLTHLFV